MMTKGVAGIGKTGLTQRFNRDWAKVKAQPGHTVHISVHFQRAECAERDKVQLGGNSSPLL